MSLVGCVMVVSNPTPTPFPSDQNMVLTVNLPEEEVSSPPVPLPPPPEPRVEIVEREVMKTCTLPDYPSLVLIPSIDETVDRTEYRPRDTEDMLVSHIQDLRTFILERETQQRAVYDEIVRRCR